MARGLRFQRKHRKLGTAIKYLYYCLFRRELLQKKTSYGSKHPEITYYIVKPDFQDCVQGLLSLIYRQLIYLDYADRKGYIPYVDWKNYKTQYSDGNNVWEYFFEQPYPVSEDDINNSKNIIVSGWAISNINNMEYFSNKVFFDADVLHQSAKFFDNYLRFNNEVLDLADYEASLFDIANTVGVYLRGTDYTALMPSGENVQPTVEQLILVLDTFIQKHKIKLLFLVTEDGKIYDKMQKHYGEMVKTVTFDSFIRDYDGKDYLSRSNIMNEDKKKRGQDYLIKMILLSRCGYFVGSITEGSKFSYILNDGQYKDEYVFNLGLYK